MSLSVQNPSINPKPVEPLRVQKSGMDKLVQGFEILTALGSLAGGIGKFQNLQGATQPQYYNPNLNDFRGAGQRIGYNSPLYNSFSGVS